MRVVNCTKVVETPHSSAIEKIWYDEKGRELYARYRGSKTVSGYRDVSALAVQNLLNAPSLGAHFDKFIKKAGYQGINTDEVVLPNDLPKVPNTTGVFKTSTWASTTPEAKGYPTGFPKKVTDSATYVVTGTVLKPTYTSEPIAANSLEEAISKFREKYKDLEPEVESVKKA